MIRALILAGPSASGKSTVASYLIENTEEFELVRSITTRMRRDGDGDDYIHISRDEFLEEIEGGRVLEYTEYLGNLYGTPYSEIERISKLGKIPIMILDINGVASVKQSSLVDAYSVYIYADISVIADRLRQRYGDKNSDVFETRLMRNRQEYETADEWCAHFDTMVENLVLPKAAEYVIASFNENKKNFSTKILKTKIK